MEVDVCWAASAKMTSTETPESTAFNQNDFDSESSSSDDRNARKRFGGELERTGLKKRRKQSTPVKFSTSLVARDDNGSEEDESEDYGVLEGKSLQQKKFLLPTLTVDSKNGDSNFPCQDCGRLFDDKLALGHHIDLEHFAEQPTQDSITTEILPASSVKPQTANFVNPVNLSTITVKNFASMIPRFDSDHGQPTLQTQLMNQNDEWSPAAVRLPMRDHVQGLPTFPQYLHFPGFPLPDSSQLPRSIGSTPPRIFNRDAYCDLCNKEFCNKYFLKTHKANKHGIYSEFPSQGTSSDTVMASSTFTEPFPKLELPQIHLDNNPVTMFTSPPIPEPVQKNAEVEDRRLDHLMQENSLDQMQTDTKDVNFSQHDQVDNMMKQEYGTEQEDSKFMPPPRHFSPQAIQIVKESGFSIDHLRRMGVLNIEAFCEICCKEYCNKYFLRTHKMKRHGVFAQETDPAMKVLAPTEIQTSPLNLIVSETGSNTESSDRSEDEQECKPCGLRFQTTDLFLRHHQKLHEPEPLKTPENEVDSSRPDTISADLQKLQTMILQLNGLETNKSTVCQVCSRDLETLPALRTHMSLEHDVLPEEALTSFSEIEKSPVPNTNTCTLCEKDCVSQEALKKHIAEEHRPSAPNSTPLPQSSQSVTTPKSIINRVTTSMTPTSSFCEICNKELCNKYFMKTHMHRMHGIEISNGAQIGGVICNICNKELCSKYFLRVHKHNTHGIIEEGTTIPLKQDSMELSSSEDTTLKLDHQNDSNSRYYTHFTEVCPICNRRFRSVKWLKAHLLGDHGKLGMEKWKECEEQYPMSRLGNRVLMPRSTQSSPSLKIPNGQESSVHQFKTGDFPTLGTQVLSNLFGSPTDDQCAKTYRCSFCSFTTIALPFLFLHERSHVNAQENQISEGSSSLQCPVCSQPFTKPELLHSHLLSSHPFPTMLSQLNSPMLVNYKLPSDNKDKKEKEGNVNNRLDSFRIPGESKAGQMPKPDNTTVQVTPQGAYKCSQCGFATVNLNRIKKHVKKDHKSIGDPTDSVIAELTRTLKEVSNKRKIPATYAIPQDMNSNPDKTIMQPFLIEEFDVLQENEEGNSMKRFAPALVYLPVNARVNAALTASFTLSPA